MNHVTTKAGLTGISGAATTYTTANAVLSAINGKSYSKAAVTGGTTPTTDVVTGAAFVGLTAGYGSVFVWGVNASGTISVCQGTVEKLDSVGAFATAAPSFPPVPDTVAPFAYVVVKAGATTSGTWTFSSSNWNATGITVSVQDVLELPDRPQVS